MRYKLIIFDWDGTVMDSVPRIVSCMQATAAQCGLAVPAATAVHDIIGLSLPVAMDALFACDSENQRKHLIDVYREHYISKDPTPSPMFGGVLDVFTQLQDRGYQLAVATGKARPGLERAWLETKTNEFFVSSCCAGEVPSKPHPAMLHTILKNTGVSARDALMVGDSVLDLKMAASAGMDSVGVTCGVHDAKRLQAEAPVQLMDTIAQLPDWLERTEMIFAQQA